MIRILQQIRQHFHLRQLLQQTLQWSIWSWTSTNPGTILKKMAECIKRSNLRELKRKILTPQSLDEPRASLEEKIEWLQHVEVGGKEFILSLEDSRLESFPILLQLWVFYTWLITKFTYVTWRSSNISEHKKKNELPTWNQFFNTCIIYYVCYRPICNHWPDLNQSGRFQSRPCQRMYMLVRSLA